jgi:inorganic triphosphatase YgiF
MEIEAKFRIDDQRVFVELLGLAVLGPYRLSPKPEPEQQRNIYFDTADGQLDAGRYGLRIRDLGTRRIATLKGASHGAGALHMRDEWEAEIGADDEPTRWPASEVRDRTLALIGETPLLAILSIRTTRRHIYVAQGDADIAEISLDEGVISAGGREQPFREVEIELLGQATRADLDAIVELLGAHFPLIPEEQSKLARGMALLAGR